MKGKNKGHKENKKAPAADKPVYIGKRRNKLTAREKRRGMPQAFREYGRMKLQGPHTLTHRPERKVKCKEQQCKEVAKYDGWCWRCYAKTDDYKAKMKMLEEHFPLQKEETDDDKEIENVQKGRHEGTRRVKNKNALREFGF